MNRTPPDLCYNTTTPNPKEKKEKGIDLKRARVGLKELSNAVEGILNASFSTHIPPMQDKDAPAQLTPSGLGWPLILAEWLCAEYGWTFEHAIDIPLPRVFALQAAARVRHGGPDYVERTLDIVKNGDL